MLPPPYTSDTSPEAREVQLEILRGMTPSQHIRRMLEMTARNKRWAFDAIRRHYPEFNESQVKLKFIEMNYGAKLADKVRIDMQERGIE